MFPEPSVTVHVTVVIPIGKAKGALFVTEATLQLSVVTGVPKDTPVAVHPLLIVMIFAGGQVIIGLIVSLIVTN